MFYLGKDTNMHTTKMCEELEIDSFVFSNLNNCFLFL